MAGKGYPGKRRSSCVPFTDLRANGCAACTERERRSVETSETRLRMSCWVRRGAGGGAAGGTEEDLGLLRSWGRRWGADMTGGRVRPVSSKNRRFSSSALISALMCFLSRASISLSLSLLSAMQNTWQNIEQPTWPTELHELFFKSDWEGAIARIGSHSVELEVRCAVLGGTLTGAHRWRSGSTAT